VTMDTCKWLYAYWLAADAQMTARPPAAPSATTTPPSPTAAVVKKGVVNEVKQRVACEAGVGGVVGNSSRAALTSTRALLANSNIAENLGQLAMLLTDKTGTLTQNRMVFAGCCCGGRVFAQPEEEAVECQPVECQAQTRRQHGPGRHGSSSSPPVLGSLDALRQVVARLQHMPLF
jgi:hypothetical protein